MDLKKKRKLMHTHTDTLREKEKTMNFNLRDEFRFSCWNQQCNSGVTIRALRRNVTAKCILSAEANIFLENDL